MTKRATRPEVVPDMRPDTGSFVERLDQPEVVGELTASEAQEIRARNELLKQLEVDVVKFQRLLAVARNEKNQFIRNVVVTRGFDLRHEYNVDDESGIISMVGRRVEGEAEAEETPAES